MTSPKPTSSCITTRAWPSRTVNRIRTPSYCFPHGCAHRRRSPDQGETIQFDRLLADLSNDINECFDGVVPVTEEIGVAGGSSLRCSPGQEHQRALEHEAVGVGRHAQAIDEPLHGEVGQQLLKRAPHLPRAIEQPMVYGVGHVPHGALRHISASRYGLMTRSMRSIRE